MRATKAYAGGIGSALGTIAGWAISLIPGWDSVPGDVRGAILLIVTTAIAGALVYASPPNGQAAVTAAQADVEDA